MFRKKLCPHCKYGQHSCVIDSRSWACPYISCHTGKKCGMYKKLDEEKKKRFFRKA